MSKRPSYAQPCTPVAVPDSYTVIGASSFGILDVYRYLRAGYTGPVNIISEGANLGNEYNISSTSYVLDSRNTKLQSLSTQRIAMVPYTSDDNCDFISFAPDQIEKIYNFYISNDVLGDVVNSYILPRFASWFPVRGTNSKAEQFMSNKSLPQDLTDAEQIVFNALKTRLNIKGAGTFLTALPSITNKTHPMILAQGNNIDRQLFLDIKNWVFSRSNVNLYTNVAGLKIAKQVGGTYNLYADAGLPATITNTHITWALHPYQFLKIYYNSGLPPRTLQVPVIYRAVLSIPKNNFASGVDLTCAPHLGDLVTSFSGFSAATKNNSNNFEWIVEAYTAVEDLSAICCPVYADADNTLLIIEAMKPRFTRTSTYNTAAQQIEISYNSPESEATTLREFATAVAAIYNSYVDPTVPLTYSQVLGESSICTGGFCKDNVMVTSTPSQVTALEHINYLISALYQSSLVQVPS